MKAIMWPKWNAPKEETTQSKMYSDMKDSVKSFQAHELINKQNKPLSCKHPEDSIRRVVQGNFLRMECKKCNSILLRGILTKEGGIYK